MRKIGNLMINRRNCQKKTFPNFIDLHIADGAADYMYM